MSKSVHVAVGVVVSDGLVLVAKRDAKQHQGDKWEFPGGKVEAGESTPEALSRELSEEVGIEIQQCESLIKISHDYGDKQVILDTLLVTEHKGQARGMEGQEVRWVDFSELEILDFPDANVAIINALKTHYSGKKKEFA